MKHLVSIATDSVRICDSKEIEAPTSMEALLAALHHETSAYKHLKDLPKARLCILVWPADEDMNSVPKTLNQEAGNCAR